MAFEFDPDDNAIVDRATVVNEAPGRPDGSLFSGFENNESVSLTNGNLVIQHPSSPSFPVEGGWSVGLSRVYNMKNSYTHFTFKYYPESWCYPAKICCIALGKDLAPYAVSVLQGRSWVGLGWISHFGRIYAKRRWNYCATESGAILGATHVSDGVYYEGPDGTRLEIKNGREDGVHRVAGTEEMSAERLGENGHYEMTFPDGSVHKFEHYVERDFQDDDEPHAWDAYIYNHDRSGHYVTSMIDVHGNEVHIEYWGELNPEHPEAIRRVYYDPGGVIRWEIKTELFCYDDDGNPTTPCDETYRGVLKRVTAQGPDGTDVAYDFEYEFESIPDHVNGGDVPTLRRVSFPGDAPGERPTVRYWHEQIADLRSTSRGGDNGRSYFAPIVRVDHPHGGASTYSYTGWKSASRRVCAPEGWSTSGSCNKYNSICEGEAGVASRTLHPRGVDPGGGVSSDYPAATWTWDREFCYRRVADQDEYNNYFTVTRPDGAQETVSMEATTMFPANSTGQMSSRVLKNADGSTEISESFEYTDAPVYDNPPKWKKRMQTEKTAEHSFGISGGACFSPGGESVTEYEDRVKDRWRKTTVSGPYLLSGDKSVQYVRYENPDDASLPSEHCRDDKGIFGAVDWVTVDEGGQRYERRYRFDDQQDSTNCAGKLTWQCATGGNFVSVALGSYDPNPPTGCTGVLDGRPTLESEVEYDGTGNVSAYLYSGGDDAPDGSSATYRVDYTWQNGRAKSMQVDGIAYQSVNQSISPSGHTLSQTDPNGQTSSFAFDDNGRITEITPPTGENATVVSYGSEPLGPLEAWTTEIASGPSGVSTTFDNSDADQEYAKLVFDGLGRVVERWEARPDDSLAVQVMRYDSMGRAVFQSEWMPGDWYENQSFTGWGDASGNYVTLGIPLNPDTGLPWGTTTFYGLPGSGTDEHNPLRITADALGRVHRVRRADGSVIDTTYCGPHKEVMAWKDDGSGPETASHARFYYDFKQRLTLVDTAPFSGASVSSTDPADAAYWYDPLGNLTTVSLVDNLPAQPFQKWRDGVLADPAYSLGQIRRFEYDAVGRLRKADIPEQKGVTDGSGQEWDTVYDAYDIWGNLLKWQDPLGQRLGYHFESTYDVSGRLLTTERVFDSDEDLLGATGSVSDLFAIGWEEGVISGGTFDGTQDASWNAVDYAAPGTCIAAPPESPNTYGLHVATGCGYSGSTSSDEEALRVHLPSVSRADELHFRFWRQTDEGGSEGEDAFSVFVVDASAGNTVTARRHVLKMDARHASHSRWREIGGVRLAELFSESEWPSSTATKSLYLYVTFAPSSGTKLGKGIMVDEFFVGRPEREMIVENRYDETHCDSSAIASPGCQGTESSDLANGQLTTVLAYQHGRLVNGKRYAYRGLNGRMSAVEEHLDWTGVGTWTDNPGQPIVFGVPVFQRYTTRFGWNPNGQLAFWGAPLRDTTETPREYASEYARGALIGLLEAVEGQRFTGDPSGTPIVYNAAGAMSALDYANGVHQTIEHDALYRSARFKTVGPGTGEPTLWDSGDYAYDGAGNITGIGIQVFDYDLAGRLVHAEVVPQASDPDGADNPANLRKIDYTYDLYGNMLKREQSPGDFHDMPAELEFNFGASPLSDNQIATDSLTGITFTYDPNGNMTRFTGAARTPIGATWTPLNRTDAIYAARIDEGGGPYERYLYDAAGYRFARIPLGGTGDGRPVITLRNGTGQALSEYRVEPGDDQATLEKDFVYGNGTLWVERTIGEPAPSMHSTGAALDGGSFPFQVDAHQAGRTYTVNIQSRTGYWHQVSGIVPAADGSFAIDEAEFSSDETNFVRIKSEAPFESPYSAPSGVKWDAGVTAQDDNQVRSTSVTRSDTTIALSWELLNQNGGAFKVYFDRGDGTPPITVTPLPLNPALREFAISTQSLSVDCGSFSLSQVVAGLETSQVGGAELPPPGGGIGGGGSGGGDECDPPPGPSDPPGWLAWVDSWHIRDHLGSLRTATGSVGAQTRAVDLLPFGIELAALQESEGGSTSRLYTGHERSEKVGLDYMLARMNSLGSARFVSVDPLRGSYDAGNPQTWSRYVYVANSPMVWVDPDGRKMTWSSTSAKRMADAQTDLIFSFVFQGWNPPTFVEVETGEGSTGVMYEVLYDGADRPDPESRHGKLVEVIESSDEGAIVTIADSGGTLTGVDIDGVTTSTGIGWGITLPPLGTVQPEDRQKAIDAKKGGKTTVFNDSSNQSLVGVQGCPAFVDIFLHEVADHVHGAMTGTPHAHDEKIEQVKVQVEQQR